MKTEIFLSLLAAYQTSALPSLKPRQELDFDLIDSTPEPTMAIDDSVNYDPEAAIAAVVADIAADPLPLSKRDKVVAQAPGYTDNLPLGNVIISAPSSDCNGVSSYMGSKMFNDGPYDTTLCAAACSATSNYNRQHTPAGVTPRTCQFYNTFAMYKDGSYAGQYCSMYTEFWPASYATSTGQTRNGIKYTHGDSYIATINTNTGSPVCSADIQGACPRTTIVSDGFENGFIVGTSFEQYAVTTLESHGLQYATGLPADTLTLAAPTTNSPNSGNYSLAVSHVQNGQGNWRGVMTPRKLCPGTDYYISGSIKSTNTAITCYAGLRVNGIEFFYAPTLTSNYQFLAAKFNSNDAYITDPNQAVLVGMASYCEGNGAVAWDDFTISTTPVAPLQPYVRLEGR